MLSHVRLKSRSALLHNSIVINLSKFILNLIFHLILILPVELIMSFIAFFPFSRGNLGERDFENFFSLLFSKLCSFLCYKFTVCVSWSFSCTLLKYVLLQIPGDCRLPIPILGMKRQGGWLRPSVSRQSADSGCLSRSASARPAKLMIPKCSNKGGLRARVSVLVSCSSPESWLASFSLPHYFPSLRSPFFPRIFL